MLNEKNFSNDDTKKLQIWAASIFKAGCLLGDLAREDEEELSEDEVYMLACAFEGWLAAGGQS